MAEMNGTQILSVKGFGTSQDDKLAYVECELHDHSVQAIAFAPELSAPICSAFLAAANHIQMKQTMRGHKLEKLIVDLQRITMTTAWTHDNKMVVLLDCSTKAGAVLYFRIDKSLADAVLEKLGGLLAKATQ